MATKEKIQRNVWVDLMNLPEIVNGRIPAAMKTIAVKGTEILNTDQVGIWMMNETRDQMYCVEQYDRTTKTHTNGDLFQILTCPNYFSAIQNVDVLKTVDVAKSADTHELVNTVMLKNNVRANISVPIWENGSLQGVVLFNQFTPREWKTEDIDASVRLSQIISNVRKTADYNALNQRFTLFHKTIDQVIQDNSRMETIQSILNDTVKMLNADSGIYYGYHPLRQELSVDAVTNLAEKYVSETVKYDEGIAGLVTKTGRQVRIDHYNLWTRNDPLFKDTKVIDAVIACPVTLRGDILGVMQINRKSAVNPFTHNDIESLKQVCSQVAMVVDYTDITERNRSYEIARRMVSRSIGTPHLDIIINQSLNMITQGLGVDIGVAQILDVQGSIGLTIDDSRYILNTLSEENRVTTQTMVVNDWNAKQIANTRLARAMNQAKIQASIITPINVSSETVGYLGVCSAIVRHWTTNEIQRVELIGQQLGLTATQAINMRTATSFEDTLLRYDVVTSNLNHLQSVDEALHHIGSGAVHIFNPHHAVIFMRTAQGNLECQWSYGMPDMYKTQIESKKTDTIAAAMFGTTKATLVVDTQMSGSFPTANDLLLPHTIRTTIYSPLVFDGRVFGTLGLFYDTVRPFSTLEMRTLAAYTNQAAVTLHDSSLFDQLDNNYRNVTLMLANAMDARDTSMPEYSQKLSKWAEATAKALGCTEAELRDIRLAALLHDIGKITVPDAILKKTGTLSTDERNILKRYPLEGEHILRGVPDLQGVGKIIRSSREHYDGKGYPEGRKGEEIPLGSRILAVADAFGSIIDDRPYQKARTPEQATQELLLQRGKQFDPVIVDAFLSTVPQRLQ